jgi:hypothetical protein
VLSLGLGGGAACNGLLGIEEHPLVDDAGTTGGGPDSTSSGADDSGPASESRASSSSGGASSTGGFGSSGSGGSGSSGGSSSSATTSGGGDSGGASSGAQPDGGFTEVPLVPTGTGTVQSSALGIVGRFYAYGDGWGTGGGPTGACETQGRHPASACSSITSPAPSSASFPPSAQGQMCISGKAAQVIGSPPDYTNIYGIGIGFDLNNAGTRMPYDAPGYRVAGFKLTLSGVPSAPGTVRVEFPIVATNGSGDAYAETVPPGATEMTVLWSDPNLQPSFAPANGMTEPPFDPSMLESIQVHIVSLASAATTVNNLCVSNLTALVQP